MLDKNFIAMANYAMLSAIGICGEIDDKVDFNEVLKYASEQAILPLVVAGIARHKNYSAETHINQLQNITLQMVANDIQNNYFISSVFDEFKKNNIKFAILKGESIAALYNEPDLRISGDVDILISENDEKMALKILKKFDYYFDKRPYWGNETIAKHNKYKMIEVHIALFDESRNDIFFKNIIKEPENFLTINSSNFGEISVLSPDDGMMFVFLHFVKHFLSSGAGVRQLIDVIVYAKHYIHEIDWNSFYNKLNEMRYYKLFEYLISIAILYFGIPENVLPKVSCDKTCAEMVLEDVQSGGNFGHNDKALFQFKRVYEKKRFDTYMAGNYNVYETRYKKSVLGFIFPSMSYMKRKYLYLNKFPFLILFAYLYRWFSAVIRIFMKKRKISDYNIGNAVDENDKINDRMKFMEKIGLV